MRLRRVAGDRFGIDDVNNGNRHEMAFTKIIEKKGTLDESLLQQESYAPGIKGKLLPRLAAIRALIASIPTAIRGIRSGKMRSVPKLIPGVHPKLPGDSQGHVKRIYEQAEESGTQLNLYIIGEGGEEEGAAGAEQVPAGEIKSEPDETEELS
jgi:succinate dehydrogenase / fumarate reductase iron-sulfur subunit